MSHDATETGLGDSVRLTAVQINVIRALVSGQTVLSAAEDANIHRSTIHRWLRENYDFQAALNASKRHLWDEITCRLLSIGSTAIETIEATIRNGNTRAALEVLKGLGLLSGKPLEIESDDPKELKESVEIQRQEAAELRVMQKSLLSSY